MADAYRESELKGVSSFKSWLWLICSANALPDFVEKLQSTDSPAVLPGNPPQKRLNVRLI